MNGSLPTEGRSTATRMFSVPGPIGELAACLGVAFVPVDPSSYEILAEAWLGVSELPRYRRFLVDSGRRDFIAGRAATKSALSRLAPPHGATTWQIVPGVWNQPCVRGPAGGLTVTLAHADGIGLAIAHDDQWVCGIDIEPISREAEDSIRHVVSDDEAGWARVVPAESSTRWMILWTAREAIGKAMRTGLLSPGVIGGKLIWNRDANSWRGLPADENPLAVRSIVFGNHIVSLAMPREVVDTPSIIAALEWIRESVNGH